MFDPSQNQSAVSTPPLSPDVPPFGDEPFRFNRALIAVPIAGIIAIMFTLGRYRPLDETSISWYGLIPAFASALLISHIQKKVKRGEDVRSYFPFTTWLAFVPMIFAVFVLLNGALDHSTAERHHAVVTQKIKNSGRSPSYYLESTLGAQTKRLRNSTSPPTSIGDSTLAILQSLRCIEEFSRYRG